MKTSVTPQRREIQRQNRHCSRCPLFIRSLIIRDATFAVTERAVKVAEAMNELTALLRANWDEMYADQGRGRALQSGGSIMWSPNWGWQILARSPAQQYCADSLNLELAAKENTKVGVALDALRNAMQLSAPLRDDSPVELQSETPSLAAIGL